MTSGRPRDISLDHFSTIHYATLREFDHFIEQDSISIRSETNEVVVAGRLYCPGRVYLDVAISLTVDARDNVEVSRYSYHAGIAGPGSRSIFRYDNAHAYAREGQPDRHHKHRFDPVTGDEIEPPEWIGEANQPTLRSVLAELEQWCLEHRQLLKPWPVYPYPKKRSKILFFQRAPMPIDRRDTPVLADILIGQHEELVHDESPRQSSPGFR